MATDYSKLKVTELKELLNSRSLPVSGKKEELVARLTESDAAKPTSSANDLLGDLAPPEEEYDWDTPTTAAKPAAAAPATAPAPAKPAPSTSTMTTTSAKPVPAPKEKVTQPDAKPETPAPATTTDADTEAALALELEKRKKRAERFGIPLAENVKALERVRRFGGAAEKTEQSKKEARGKKLAIKCGRRMRNRRVVLLRKLRMILLRLKRLENGRKGLAGERRRRK